MSKDKTSGAQMKISVICTMYEVSVLFITDMEECQGHQTLWSNDHFYHTQLHVTSSQLDVQNNLHTYPYGVYQKNRPYQGTLHSVQPNTMC
jgi:hypothetical protein